MNTEKTNAGRPTNDDEAATGHVHIRTTLARKGQWVRAARKDGKKLSEWATEILDKASGYDCGEQIFKVAHYPKTTYTIRMGEVEFSGYATEQEAQSRIAEIQEIAGQDGVKHFKDRQFQIIKITTNETMMKR